MTPNTKIDPEQERYNQLVAKLKNDFGHIHMVRGALADIENKTGVYTKMDLNGINLQLEKLVAVVERTNAKQYTDDKRTDSQLTASDLHSDEKMKEEFLQANEKIRELERESDIVVDPDNKFSV